MKTLRSLVVLSLVSFTSLAHSQYILTLRCNEMDAYIGKLFQVRVTETGSGEEVGRKTIPVIQNDTFEIQLYVLLDGVDYDVDFYVDVSGNGMYDAPPADHSWRRTISDPSGPEQITFVPDANYLYFIFPDDIQYGYYEATWGGRWMNLTFGSTDSIEASLEIGCDSLFISFTTAGVFGNPATVSFDFAEARLPDYDPVTDTLHFSVDAPWTGELYIINGELHGDLLQMGIGLEFTGTVGLQQIVSHYTVTNGGSLFANGYFYVKELEVINELPPLELDLLGTPISCHGVNDGTVWASVNGGTGNYEYAWPETGATTPYIEGLWADTFHVIVTDDLGCSVADSIILDVTGSVSIIDVYTTNASCPGACDALIEINATGGMLPFTYTIDSDSCTGFMTIYVTDAKGCLDSTEIFIFSDSNIEVVAINLTPATAGQSDGSVVVEVEGGILPYLYSLDGIFFQASPVFSGLPPGAYCIFISDANECLFKTDTFLIENNSTGINFIASRLRVYPNPVSTTLYVESDSPVSIDLLSGDGRMLKHNDASGKHALGVVEFPCGMYVLRISDGGRITFYKIILQ